MSDKTDDREIKVQDKRRFSMEGGEVKKNEGETDRAADAPDETKTESKSTPADRSSADTGARHGSLPEVSFMSLIFSLAGSAMMYLGEVADPEGKSVKDTAMAKQTIDLWACCPRKPRET
ncbi:MAG: DUF1844 domain-containing protein [Deltaproteobacteria bacterium]|nr:DUF1844 domain-containing protein [Deltaproteobacteria bacterium]